MNCLSQVSSSTKKVRERPQGPEIFPPHEEQDFCLQSLFNSLFPSIILLIFHTHFSHLNRSVVHQSSLEGHMSSLITPSACPYCSCSSLTFPCSMPVVPIRTQISTELLFTSHLYLHFTQGPNISQGILASL